MDILKNNNLQDELNFQLDLKHRKGFIWQGEAKLQYLITSHKKLYTLSIFKLIYHNERLQNKIKSYKNGTIVYPSEYRSLLLKDQRDLVQKLHAYINERLDRKLQPISVISREVGGSATKLKSIFQNAYGETIYEYHLRKRLEKAHILIQNTILPINEIAEECGFISLSHFSRAFKKYYGVPPTRFRKL